MDGYTLGLYEKSMPGSLSLPEKLAAAREAGYDCLEISIDETDEKLARLDWGEEERLRLVESAAAPAAGGDDVPERPPPIPAG